MVNPLLRKAQMPQPEDSTRYRSLGLRSNPFPIDPGLKPDSGDPRSDGTIYNDILHKDSQADLQRLLIGMPGTSTAHSLVFLMDYATKRGRGIGKSAFLHHQCERVMSDFGERASEGRGVLLACHVIPPPDCRKFWQFCRAITECLVNHQVVALALWRLRALSGVIPSNVLEEIGDASEWPTTIGDSKWLESRGVDVLFRLNKAVEGTLVSNGVPSEWAKEMVLSSDTRAPELVGPFLRSSDFFWRKEGPSVVFGHLVNLFRAAEFTRGLLLVDEFEKVVYPQNTQERRLFVDSLRYYMFDVDVANARSRFWGVLLTIHPGIQEILLPYWKAAGLDRFSPLAGPDAGQATVYFGPLSGSQAVPLVVVYLDHYRLDVSKKGTLEPFTQEAVVEALVQSGGVPGPTLRLLHRVVEQAADLGKSKIDKDLIEVVRRTPERLEASEISDESGTSETRVRLTEGDD